MRLPDIAPRLTSKGIEQGLKHLFTPSVQKYVAEANREYLPWEKLRRHPPPEKLAPEDAWMAVKMSRVSQKRFLTLRDENGDPFSYWLPTPALEILHEVDRWGGTTLALAEGTAPLLGAMRDRVIVSSLMEEAIATSQIEGAVTTRRVAKEMLRTNRKPRNRSEQMIVNSYGTIQLLRQRLDRPLSIDLLFEIQESMTRETLEDVTAVGRFRTKQDNICIVDERDSEVVFTPPPPELMPERLSRLIDFANAPAEGEAFIHPLAKAAILHFWLAYEHPFVDGNGRTARALFYWFMLKNGYWLFEFLTISRIIAAAPMQYYRSFLYSEQDDDDLTYFVIAQLRATQRAVAALRVYLAEKQAEQQAMAAALRGFPDLNHRQRALLDHALRRPAQVYTFQSHKNSHNISLLTARTDLLALAKRGLLSETKEGRRRGFLPAVDLARRLAPEVRPSPRRTRTRQS
jgi:Fic family protein